VYVSPVEVENALIGHPAVHESGVVGYRDEAGLEKAMAYVELSDGRTASDALEQDIIEFARGVIAPFKAPRRIVFVDELPRTETGKIKRGELRKMAAGDGQ
jgi:acyl-coenzyme A synthetase/AMP-(fatty) acid ligase